MERRNNRLTRGKHCSHLTNKWNYILPSSTLKSPIGCIFFKMQSSENTAIFYRRQMHDGLLTHIWSTYRWQLWVWSLFAETVCGLYQKTLPISHRITLILSILGVPRLNCCTNYCTNRPAGCPQPQCVALNSSFQHSFTSRDTIPCTFDSFQSHNKLSPSAS